VRRWVGAPEKQGAATEREKGREGGGEEEEGGRESDREGRRVEGRVREWGEGGVVVGRLGLGWWEGCLKIATGDCCK
jgi:hypothetical protein